MLKIMQKYKQFLEETLEEVNKKDVNWNDIQRLTSKLIVESERVRQIAMIESAIAKRGKRTRQ